jgi:glutaconate CoA-transferase subunit A
MAQASAHTLVTVEEVRDTDLLASEETAAGALSAAYVSAIAVAPRGAWPLRFWDLYPADEAHLALYGEMARTQAGFDDYLGRFGGPESAEARDSREVAGPPQGLLTSEGGERSPARPGERP